MILYKFVVVLLNCGFCGETLQSAILGIATSLIQSNGEMLFLSFAL